MATMPNLTIDNITNAIITDQGTSVSVGKISWSVAEQAESDFSATKANYNADTSGWSSRYYWSAKSGTTNFNGLVNTVVVSTQVTVYTKSIVKSSSGTFVTLYSDESSAQTACNNVAGSSTYVYEYSYGNHPAGGALGYCVYRYDLSISTSSSSVTLTQNVDVSNYITVQVIKPSPTYSLSYEVTSATALVDNLSSGDSVVFTIYNGTNGNYITSSSGTASSSSMSLSVSGLSAGTSYSALVTVNGTSLGYTNFTTNAVPQPTYEISAVTHSSATVIVSNIESGDTVVFEVSEGASGANFQSASGTASGSSITLSISGLTPSTQHTARILVNGTSLGYQYFTTSDIPQPTYTYSLTNIGTESVTVIIEDATVDSSVRLDVINATNGHIVGSSSDTVDSSSSAILSVGGLDVGLEYIVRVYIDEALIDNGTSFMTLFDWWISDIRQYAPINSWQNPANGNTHPAPVTAIEWNRLVNIVNKKCKTSIPTVASGERMKAGTGQNVRMVADTLGVSVDSEWIITAQFFLDLRDAINIL